MQSQLTIVNPHVATVSTRSILQRIVSWVTRMFGCWHLEMSRPFSHHGQAYRSCLNCGAQRKFNLSNWEMQGSYYYSRPNIRHQHMLSGFAAVKKAA
jgi:hypothetical protein